MCSTLVQAASAIDCYTTRVPVYGSGTMSEIRLRETEPIELFAAPGTTATLTLTTPDGPTPFQTLASSWLAAVSQCGINVSDPTQPVLARSYWHVKPDMELLPLPTSTHSIYVPNDGGQGAGFIMIPDGVVTTVSWTGAEPFELSYNRNRLPRVQVTALLMRAVEDGVLGFITNDGMRHLELGAFDAQRLESIEFRLL